MQMMKTMVKHHCPLLQYFLIHDCFCFGYLKVIGLLALLVVVTQPQVVKEKASWFKSKSIMKV